MTSGSPVAVWLIDLDRDGDAFAQIAERDGVLSANDRRRIASARHPADALALAASRAGLRQVLGHQHLQRTKSGQPFAAGRPAFSLSHTRDYVAIAVNRAGSVGVDIETVGRDVPQQPLISCVAALLGDAWPSARLPLAAWTITEAWTKLHGLTLAEVLDSPGRGRDLEAAVETRADRIHLAPLDLPPGLVGACWYEGPAASITVRKLEPQLEPAAHLYPNVLA